MNEKTDKTLENESGIMAKIELLWDLVETEDFATIIEQAQEYVESESIEIATGASRLLAVAYNRLEKFPEAIRYFEKTAEISGEANDYFDIVIAATLSGNIDKGKEAFDKALSIGTGKTPEQESSTPFLRLYYSSALRDSGEYMLALKQLNELKPYYVDLETTDPNFVYTNGVPFFADSMAVAKDVFHALGDQFDAGSWIDDFAASLDADGQALLDEMKQELNL